MSSNRVKGITVEINGSTTGLDKALSNCKSKGNYNHKVRQPFRKEHRRQP